MPEYIRGPWAKAEVVHRVLQPIVAVYRRKIPLVEVPTDPETQGWYCLGKYAEYWSDFAKFTDAVAHLGTASSEGRDWGSTKVLEKYQFKLRQAVRNLLVEMEREDLLWCWYGDESRRWLGLAEVRQALRDGKLPLDMPCLPSEGRRSVMVAAWENEPDFLNEVPTFPPLPPNLRNLLIADLLDGSVSAEHKTERRTLRILRRACMGDVRRLVTYTGEELKRIDQFGDGCLSIVRKRLWTKCRARLADGLLAE